MTYQAIVTKYLGPTNTKGSRIKATCDAGSVTIPFPYELNQSERHWKAAETLTKKLGWDMFGGTWYGGGLPNNAGSVFVWSSNESGEFVVNVDKG